MATQPVRSFSFLVKYGKTYGTATSNANMKVQIPVISNDTLNAIIAAGNLSGSGSKKLIDFESGPTATLSNMVQAGFNPPTQCRLGFLTAETPNDREYLLTTAFRKYFNCFNFSYAPMMSPDKDEDKLNCYLVYDGGYLTLEYNSAVNGIRFFDNKDADGLASGMFPSASVVQEAGNSYGSFSFGYIIPGELSGGSITATKFTVFTMDIRNDGVYLQSPWYGNNSALARLFGKGSGSIPSEDIIMDADNPYDQGGTSGGSDLDGDFSDSSDNIGMPSGPSWSVADVGMTTIYTPTISQMRALAAHMWSADFVDNILKMIADPRDAIISSHALPVHIPVSETTGIVVAGIDTGILSNVPKTQWVNLDCGSLTISPYWGGFMDYAPYTSISLFLPYIGEVTLDTDEVMGHKVNLKYVIDIMSGMCIAVIGIDGTARYQYSGTCSYDIPITSADYRTLLSAGVGIVVGLAAGPIAGFGASALMGATSAQGPTQGGMAGIGQRAKLAAAGAASTAAMGPVGAAGSKLALAGATALAVTGVKPTITHTGPVTGQVGVMGIQTPYITIKRPRQCVAGQQGDYVGFPLWATRTVGQMLGKGYTEYASVHVESIPLTADELDELESMLTGGVIL